LEEGSRWKICQLFRVLNQTAAAAAPLPAIKPRGTGDNFEKQEATAAEYAQLKVHFQSGQLKRTRQTVAIWTATTIARMYVCLSVCLFGCQWPPLPPPLLAAAARVHLLFSPFALIELLQRRRVLFSLSRFAFSAKRRPHARTLRAPLLLLLQHTERC
jgi:hypothetical protein